MDRRLEESGIRKIAKLVGQDFAYFNGNQDESEKNRVILKHIEDCCYAISNEGKDTADSQLFELAETLRNHFSSDYCAIGKVDGNFVEDCAVSINPNYKNNKSALKRVKRVSIDNMNCCVCRGLKSEDNIVYFNENEIKESVNYNVYKDLLGEVNYTTIIPIRDKDDANKGYVQFINSRKKIVFNNIKPLYDSLMKLILIIKLNDVTLFKNDYDFISEVQKKVNDVDTLLTVIMKYLSKEFNAGVISFRIPLLVGTDNKPLFFLRDCYIREEIACDYSKDDYFSERLVKNKDEMGGYDRLKCKKIEPVITDKAKDTEYYSKIKNPNISFRIDTLIIPILRDYSKEEECPTPQKCKEGFCDDEVSCPFRLCKYFGVFKLRILKDPKNSDNDEADEWLTDDARKRLSNLAKHISILLNANVEKHENKSLDVFLKELKGTSFTRIKDFDEQCSKIVKKAIHSSNCAIFRYKNDKKLTLSASSNPIGNDFNEIVKEYGNHVDGLEMKLFDEKRPVYFVRIDKEKFNSILIVPMIRKNKNNSKLGVVLLVGKDINNMDNLSKTFWEHDKKHIEFIVDVLTRIEESDSERLTFLSQLSHELRRPITEMVSRNEYVIKTATRNIDSYSKKQLIKEMQDNFNMCDNFKYIIEDVELIYSMSKGEVRYDFEMADLKKVIVDSIRLFEDEARVSKNIEIKTYLVKMPEKLYIDKSRMKQVAINLLKNAIQYSLPQEKISISYEYDEKEDCHEINFSNNGIPINPKEKEAIFEMFFRSKQAVEKRPSGTGIGLYLVKQIMKAHGGDCFVKEFSFPTTFTIQIPNQNSEL